MLKHACYSAWKLDSGNTEAKQIAHPVERSHCRPLPDAVVIGRALGNSSRSRYVSRNHSAPCYTSKCYDDGRDYLVARARSTLQATSHAGAVIGIAMIALTCTMQCSAVSRLQATTFASFLLKQAASVGASLLAC